MFQNELKHFELLFQEITKGKCSCFPAAPPELGYTDQNANIFIAEKHPYYEGLSKAEEKMFRLGIFCHEMLHQMFSNFAILKRMRTKLSCKEYSVFCDCYNLVEDAGIEYMGTFVLKGKLIKALQYSIQTIYEKTPTLQEAPSPYQQFICALVQFGDVGVLKGDFSFPEAKECFNKVAPIFNHGIESKSSVIRKNCAIKIMELAKPLWEKEKLENIQNNLQNSRTLDGGNSACDGKSIQIHEPEQGSDIFEEQRKRYVIGKKNNLFSDKKIIITESDLNWLETAEIITQQRKQKKEIQEKEESIDYSIKTTSFPEISIQHKNITTGDWNKYNTQMVPYRSIIMSFTKKLQNIFQNDKSETVKRKKGKLNVERYYAPRKTPRVFDKKTIPKYIQDMAVVIAIDESGSMLGLLGNKRKTEVAKEIAACFAESFSRFSIPLYVFGFHCFENANVPNVQHNHYIKWHNTKKERTKLLSDNCYGGNYDAASINWAVELLKKRKERNKLLIVIADGVPSVGNITEIKEEVRKARKLGYSVLGVAIGEEAVNEIKFTYEKDFFHVSSVETAFSGISKVISRMICSL